MKKEPLFTDNDVVTSVGILNSLDSLLTAVKRDRSIGKSRIIEDIPGIKDSIKIMHLPTYSSEPPYEEDFIVLKGQGIEGERIVYIARCDDERTFWAIGEKGLPAMLQKMVRNSYYRPKIGSEKEPAWVKQAYDRLTKGENKN